MKLVIEDREGVRTSVAVPASSAEIALGRGEPNQVRLEARNVSRRHARLRQEAGRFVIEDLGSFTGVRVNGARIAGPTPVTRGDLVEIGDYALALADDADAVPFGLAVRIREGRLGPPAPDRAPRLDVPRAPGGAASGEARFPTGACPRSSSGGHAPDGARASGVSRDPGSEDAGVPAVALRPLAVGGAAALLLLGLTVFVSPRPSARSPGPETVPPQTRAPPATRAPPGAPERPEAGAVRTARPAPLSPESPGAADPDQAARDRAARRAVREGERRLRARDAAAAIARFQEAIGERPARAVLGLAYRGLGRAYVAAGDGKRGAEYLKLYLPLCPASERPRLEEAIARYDK